MEVSEESEFTLDGKIETTPVNEIKFTLGEVKRVGKNRDVKYTRLWKIGEGSYNEVYLARRNTDGIDVVLKCAKYEEEQLTEVHVLQSMPEHPNIILLLDSNLDERYTVLEYCPGELYRWVMCAGGFLGQQNTPETAKQYGLLYLQVAHDIISGLAHLHDHGVIHTDMKPNNLLISDNSTVVIADLGMAAFVTKGSSAKARGTIGTFEYRAPEILEQQIKILEASTDLSYQEQMVTFTSAVDMWAVGCILFFCISGRDLFEYIFDLTPQRQLQRVKHDIVGKIKTIPEFVPHLHDFLLRLLEVDPIRRITAKEALHYKVFATFYEHIMDFSSRDAV